MFWSSTFEVEDVLSVDVTQFHPPESLCVFFLFGLLRAYHHLGDKVDNGAGGLLGVVFGEQVTHILCAASAFPRNKAKDPVKHTHAQQ